MMCFLQATRSSGSLHISFKLSPVHSFSRTHGPLAPSTSHSNSALTILSPGHTVLWLPPHLIQTRPCPFFLQATRSSGSLHISFKLGPVHSFSRPHGPLAPSTSHSNSALSILSPGHTVLWLPPHLIQTQPCPFFLQATRSSGSLHISFKLGPVHSFSRPHGPLAPSTPHSNSALSILSPGHTVLWLPPHLIQTRPCPFFLQATWSSGSLHISIELSHVHSFISSSHCLADLPRDLFPSTLYCKIVFGRVPFALTTCPNHSTCIQTPATCHTSECALGFSMSVCRAASKCSIRVLSIEDPSSVDILISIWWGSFK